MVIVEPGEYRETLILNNVPCEPRAARHTIRLPGTASETDPLSLP
jgi:hypothetical protein